MKDIESGGDYVSRSDGDAPLDEHLASEWQSALAGDQPAQGRWEVVDGGEWRWHGDGVRVRGTGPEWLALHWRGWEAEAARGLKNFVIEVTVGGRAEAAGVSFGPFKDFLAGVNPRTGPRHLQLEVDVEAGRWAFRVDGQLTHRCWWDAGVGGVEDILNGALRLKVRYAEEVLFQNLTLHTFEASCQLSVIVTCWRFLQRLRLSLRNWCHQDLPSGAYEVLVVNPQSPDGTHEHLAAVARSYPHVRVREVAVEGDLVTNKGAMINRAFAASRGEWIWLTDADCLFGPGCAATVLRQIRGRHTNLFYGERRFLTQAQTDALLSGRLDALREFDELAQAAVARAPEKYPWGYTQVVHRSTLARLRYHEELNHFAHSDGIFADECKRHQIMPLPLEGLFCLHLDHPFSWYGTDIFL
jgi:hypothetical protein